MRANASSGRRYRISQRFRWSEVPSDQRRSESRCAEYVWSILSRASGVKPLLRQFGNAPRVLDENQGTVFCGPWTNDKVDRVGKCWVSRRLLGAIAASPAPRLAGKGPPRTRRRKANADLLPESRRRSLDPVESQKRPAKVNFPENPSGDDVT